MPPACRPKLLGLDLDGTVLDDSGAVPATTLGAMRACREAGIAIAYLTGRRPYTAGPVLDSIGMDALVATNSGCLLWKYPGWNQIARRMFPPALLPRIVELTAPYSLNLYLDSSQAGLEFLRFERQTTPEAAVHMERWGGNTRVVHSLAELEGFEVTQVALPAAPEIVRELHARIRSALDGQVSALAVRWPLLPTLALEVFGPQAHKGGALSFFAERLGIRQEDTACAGDDVNDITMLQWAGHSAAMPHAPEEVQSAADEVLPAGADTLTDWLTRLAELPQHA